MDYSNISPRIHLLTNDDKILTFSRSIRELEKNPSPTDCKKSFKCISMDYAFCGEQDFGIDDIQTAFDATDNDMIIKKDSTKIVTSKTAKAIMYGDVTLNNTLAKEANRVGLIGYWDKSNFIICAGKNYSFIIDEIKSMIVPKHCRFGFTQGFMGRGNLVILKI